MNSNLKHVIKKINLSKLEINPFPSLLIKNFLPKTILNSFILSLPSFEQMQGSDIFTQSKSDTKRSFFYNSKYFKKIMKQNNLFPRKLNFPVQFHPQLRDI